MKATGNLSKDGVLDWIAEWVAPPLIALFFTAGFWGSFWILHEIGWTSGLLGIGSLAVAGGIGLCWLCFWLAVTGVGIDEN